MKRRQLEAGMTLIEMMIAVVISMVLSVAVMLVMSSFEGRRRTLGSASDLDQAGSLAMFQVDRWVRSAGTGLVNASGYTYGCELFAAKNNAQILPALASPPAPFDAANTLLAGIYRLAPVVILPGQTVPNMSGQPSDVLVLMSSGNDGSQVPTPVSAAPTAAQMPVANTTEFQPADLLLIADKQPAPGGGPDSCMVSQADALTPTNGVGVSLPLGGAYYSAAVGTRTVASFTDASVAIALGASPTSATGQPPTFQLVGVGDNDTLFSYDLLKTTASPLQAQAEGVFEMHAIYGVDSTGSSSNVIDQWVDATTSAYTAAALTAGTPAATLLLKNIRAVEVALIMRTALPEKDPVTAATTLTMFLDHPALAKTRTLTTAEQHYRYRVVETTIPVRNNNY